MKICIFIFVVLLISCKSQGSSFLDNFTAHDKINSDFRYEKQISQQDLAILMATNEANEAVLTMEHKYYYGYKKKLNDNHYLISFASTYRPTYRFTNVLSFWQDVFICIYDKSENKVISKLRIKSADPIFSSYTEENGVYTITSRYITYECGDADCTKLKSKSNTVVQRYKLSDNKFQQIKD